MKVKWEDVCEAYEHMRLVWWNTSNAIDWLKKAWDILDKQNLNQYENDIERHIVAARALVLPAMYLEFFEYLIEEKAYSSYLEVEHFISLLELNPIRIGQLLPRDSYMFTIFDTDVAMSDALYFLMEEERNAVYEALQNGYKNHMLYADLYRSMYDDPREIVSWFDEDDDSLSEPSEDDILNEIMSFDTVGEMEAVLWIDNGMQSTIK